MQSSAAAPILAQAPNLADLAKSVQPRLTRPPRQPRRALHGVLLLDKPIGWTSNDALQKAKGILRAEKAGHTGTLDPLATGLLPLCFGAATKFSQASLDADKRYTATLRLGQRTTTADGEGEVTLERAVKTTLAAVEAACLQLTGEIDQTPPMHSALKVDGKPLYAYARSGVEIERAKRRITIHHIRVLAHDLQSNTPSLTLDVLCSKGTYIRTLAEDLGELLGCGAHLSALRRTASGQLTLAGAVTLEALQALTEREREALLQPPEALVATWPEFTLAADEAARFLCGLRRRVQHPDMPAVRVYAAQQNDQPRAFLGTGHITQGELIADRLLSPSEVRATP
jgi:tRNA pseudouridine55 synthase